MKDANSIMLFQSFDCSLWGSFRHHEGWLWSG